MSDPTIKTESINEKEIDLSDEKYIKSQDDTPKFKKVSPNNHKKGTLERGLKLTPIANPSDFINPSYLSKVIGGKGKQIQCPSCKYVWGYKGKKDEVICHMCNKHFKISELIFPLEEKTKSQGKKVISVSIDKSLGNSLDKFCEYKKDNRAYHLSKSDIVNTAIKEYLKKYDDGSKETYCPQKTNGIPTQSPVVCETNGKENIFSDILQQLVLINNKLESLSISLVTKDNPQKENNKYDPTLNVWFMYKSSKSCKQIMEETGLSKQEIDNILKSDKRKLLDSQFERYSNQEEPIKERTLNLSLFNGNPQY